MRYTNIKSVPSQTLNNSSSYASGMVRDLQTPVRSAGRKYSFLANKLEKLGINTLEDFLFHIPFRYEDYRIISAINNLQIGETVTIRGEVEEIKNEYTRRGLTIQKARIIDATGAIDAVWFNQPFITRVIKKGDQVSISGRVGSAGKHITIQVRDYEVLGSSVSEAVHTGRLVPVYPETYGLTSKYLRNRIKELLTTLTLSEHLPRHIIAKYNLLSINEAIFTIHFPKTLEGVVEARRRLSFDELFFTQLSAKYKRIAWERVKVTNPFRIDIFKKEIGKFYDVLPFKFTSAQKKADAEIFSDLSIERPMNRMLQGDVGSGKTVVASSASYLAYLNGFQTVFMAPTEILARQHFETISKLLGSLNVKVGLVTGSKKVALNGVGKAARMGNVKRKTSNDTGFDTDQLSTNFDILIGTHALLNEKVSFDKLGLVIIDEQQRFGVQQRAILREKGQSPHFLTMTATPIPRTVFLTIYGDLDLSYLDEMPAGRQVVKTWLIPEQKRESCYEWIKKQIKILDANGNKNQIFIICPFIEESESMTTVKAAVKEFERLKTRVFSELSLGLLHGKLKPKEKEQVLKDFADQKIDILVATPVVEVGIDIPNATVIVIEAAERFGLSQLHQLRGRVGRGSKQSYCFLFTESKNPITIRRLKSLEKIYIGAELAELDLKLRGPGDVYGTMQHGTPLLKVASFTDFELIEATRKEVELIISKINDFPELIEKISKYDPVKISPD